MDDEKILILICGDCTKEDTWTDEDCRFCQRNMKAVSKAARRELIEWLSEPCLHRDNDFPCPDHVPPELQIPRRECPDCWQSLLKELIGE